MYDGLHSGKCNDEVLLYAFDILALDGPHPSIGEQPDDYDAAFADKFVELVDTLDPQSPA